MRMLLRAVFLAFALIAAIPAAAKQSVDEVPAGKLPADAIPRHYVLHFTVDPRADRFIYDFPNSRPAGCKSSWIHR